MSDAKFTEKAAPNTPSTNQAIIYLDSTTGEMTAKKDTGAEVSLEESGTDINAKVSASDTTTGFLNDEIVVDNGTNSTNPLEKTIQNPSANENLRIRFEMGSCFTYN